MTAPNQLGEFLRARRSRLLTGEEQAAGTTTR